MRDESRYWVCDLDPDVPEHADASNLFGAATVGLVDEEEGGIIAWIAESNAVRLAYALNAQ